MFPCPRQACGLLGVGGFCRHPLLIVCSTSDGGRSQRVKVRPNLADRVGGGERVAHPAVLPEQDPALLLAGAQGDPADLRVRVGVVAVQERKRHRDAEADVDDHEGQTPHLAGPRRLSLQCVARALGATPDRDEEHGQPEQGPEQDEGEYREHRARTLSREAREWVAAAADPPLRGGSQPLNGFRSARGLSSARGFLIGRGFVTAAARTRSSSPAEPPRGSPRPRSRLRPSARPARGGPARRASRSP